MVMLKLPPAGRSAAGSTVTVLPWMATWLVSPAAMLCRTVLPSRRVMLPLPASTGSLNSTTKCAPTAMSPASSAGYSAVITGARVSPATATKFQDVAPATPA